MVVVFTFFCLCFTAISSQHTNQVNKCCFDGEQLDKDFRKCIPISGLTVSDTEIKSFNTSLSIDAMDWIPKIYQRIPLKVLYGMLHKVTYDRINVYSLTKGEFLIREYLQGQYLSKIDLYCVDMTADPSHPSVKVGTYKLLDIHKCCNKFEQLNVHANACVSYSDKQHVSLQQEVINFIPSPYEKPWYIYGKQYFMLNYNIIHKGYNFNRIFKYPSDVPNLFIGDGLYKSSTAYFTRRDEIGNMFNEATDAFCFDSTEESQFAPHVLLAAVYDIYKCCHKGQHFNIAIGKCISRTGEKGTGVLNEITHYSEQDEVSSWIPTYLRTSPVSVRYNAFATIQKIYDNDQHVVYNEDIWKIQKGDNGLPTLSANISLSSGKSIKYQTQRFCLETIEDNEQILTLQNFPQLQGPQKCCFNGKALTDDGICKSHNGTDWAPALADKRIIQFPSLTPYFAFYLPLEASCYRSRFHFVSSWKKYFADNMKLNFYPKSLWSYKAYCTDYLISSGTREQMLAYCTILSIGNTYETVRPVGVLSAALLLAAAAVVVARNDTRRSAHGRALVAHALCLALANVVQVTWFFNVKKLEYHCPVYSYPAYFFMISANWWLTAITVNMMKNFRRPLGAMARGAGGGTSPSAVWRRFGIMSAFAWGGSTTLTIFVITMHQYREKITEKGMIPPSFFETRTCGIELNNILRDQIYYELMFTNRLGALLYYYIPVVLLVAVNGVCMVLTALRMRELSKDSGFAHGCDSAKNKKERETFKNVSFYVKLMLTTGLTELLIEAVAWSLGQYLTIDRGISAVHSKENLYRFGIFSTLLDLFRAICMFWLCMGPWCNLSAGWQHCMKAIGVLWNQVRQWMRNLLALARRACWSEQTQLEEMPLNVRAVRNNCTSYNMDTQQQK